jgi:hypothetical protein
MSSFMKITLAFQLIGFAVYGLFVGSLVEHKIKSQRIFTTQVLISVPINKLSELDV